MKNLTKLSSRGAWTLLLSFILPAMVCVCQSETLCAAEIEILNVQAGVDQHFKIGCRAPLEFSLRSSKAYPEVKPRIRTVDPDGHAVISELTAFALAADDEVQLSTEFRSGRDQAPIVIEILAGDKLLASRTIRSDAGGSLTSMQQKDQIWVLIGEQPPFEAAFERAALAHPKGIHRVQLSDLQNWNWSSRSLEAVDLIVANGDTHFSAAASQAIEGWVSRGGRFVMALGGDSENILDSDLTRWLPIVPRGTFDVRNLDGLHTMISGSSRLLMRASIPGAELEIRDGRVIARGLSRPIIARGAFGLGSVGVVACRLDAPVLARWGSRSDLAMIIAGMDSIWDDPEFLPQEADTDLNPTGVGDYQTQIVHAIDDSESVHRPTYWAAMGWMALLAIVIGPLDYYLLHHLVKRPNLTWFTLPMWLFLIAFWTVNSAIARNDRPMSMRQIDLVDIDTTRELVRGRAWANVYSAQTRRYDVDAVIQLPLQQPIGDATFLSTSWVERPESGYRGMYRRGSFDAQKSHYSLTQDQQHIKQLPIRVWTTRSIGTEWELPITTPLVTSELTDPGTGRLQGQLKHHLPIELHDWFLAYGAFVYVPRTPSGEPQEPLQPDESFDIADGRSNILRSALLRLRGSTTKGRVETKIDTHIDREDYDPFSSNAYDIFRILSFHHVTGGIEYSGLTNQSLKELDLTEQLELGRAVLFGRIETPASEFRFDGEQPPLERFQTIVRLILPVNQHQRATDAPPLLDVLETP